MPLVRYEVQCEHSLANPDLYRTAGRDDSEGLLEGVAMAGLVGIVRQLGDLAEFAAEIFHNLHDDIVAIVSRGQLLKARVARLEVDLPAVEKALLAEPCRFRFAYSARSKWRATLPMDHNLCALGELPPFVQKFYEDCRGPPRLFLLDKFDEAGRGACVKRYTNPSFFRISWATTQIGKVEQWRQEREDLLKTKNLGLEKVTDNPVPKIFARERLSSALLENLEGFTGDFTPDLRSRRLDRVLEIPTDGDLTPDGPRSPERETGFQKRPHLTGMAPQKISVNDIEIAKLGRMTLKPDENGTTSEEGLESYVDALATMGSNSDSEFGFRGRSNADSAQSGFAQESEHVMSLNYSLLKAHVEAFHLTPPGEYEMDHDIELGLRLGLQERKYPVAVIDAVECLSDTLDSPHARPSADESNAFESVGIVNALRNDYVSLPDEAAYEEESLQATMPDKIPEKIVGRNVEQAATTPRSRRLWAKDNGFQVQSSIFSVNVSGGPELSNILRARVLESNGLSDEDIVANVLFSRGEESVVVNPGPCENEFSRRPSSNTSSPYTNVSLPNVAAEDGYTSSGSLSPKGANFGALLLSPESSPGLGREFMGSPTNSDANSCFGIHNLAPPVTQFLSSSPSVSSCPSINEKPCVTTAVDVCQSSRLPPQLIPSGQRVIMLHNFLPIQKGVSSISSSVNASDKPYNLPALVSRPRTWVNRSESNVAATLRAIRQAAVVESDDGPGNECLSDFSRLS